jgi:nucleoside-diphosphate-sugar epimerase
MQRILITGGAGFIGSSLAEHLLKRDDVEVVLVDNMLTGLAKNLPAANGRCRFIKCDANVYQDISAVMLTRPFDFVFHYAAVVGVQRTLQNPVLVLRDIDGFRNILDLCKNTGVRRVFFASSSEVYGEPFEFPQNEHTTPLNSRLPYAVVKNLGEAFLRSYFQEFGLPYTIFRFFNTYGPRQNADFVVARFIRQALAGEDITIYGDGSQTRTFCFIDDNVEATSNACFAGHFVNDVVNIGNDLETPVLELARKIVLVTGSKSKIVHLPPLPEGDMDRRKPDITKMRSLLSRPLTELEAGLRRTVEAKRR